MCVYVHGISYHCSQQSGCASAPSTHHLSSCFCLLSSLCQLVGSTLLACRSHFANLSEPLCQLAGATCAPCPYYLHPGSLLEHLFLAINVLALPRSHAGEAKSKLGDVIKCADDDNVADLDYAAEAFLRSTKPTATSASMAVRRVGCCMYTYALHANIGNWKWCLGGAHHLGKWSAR